MKFKKWLETKTGSYTIAICSGVLLWTILDHLPAIGHALASFIGFFKTVIYALILAYLMNFIVRLFTNHVFKNMKNESHKLVISVVFTVALTVLLIVLLSAALIPQLVTSITNLLTNWHAYINKLSITISTLFNSSNSTTKTISAWLTEAVSALNDYISDNSSNIITTITTLGTGILDWIIAFILAVYFLLAKNWLPQSFHRLMEMLFPKQEKVNQYIHFDRVKAIFSRYVVCEIIDALIVGTANAIFMTIMRMPYVALISVIVGVTNLAPTFGPIVGALLGSFILLLIDPLYVLWFLIFTIILQFFDGYILKPKMYGSALSVPSVWILVAIIVLGKMFGVIGILLAIPVAAIITYIVKDYMTSRDAEQHPEAQKNELR